MKFVDDWNLVHKKWSFKLHACGTAVMGMGASLAHPLKSAWENLPDGIRSIFPPWVVMMIGFVLMVAGLCAAYIAQPKIEAARDAQAQPGEQS